MAVGAPGAGVGVVGAPGAGVGAVGAPEAGDGVVGAPEAGEKVVVLRALGLGDLCAGVPALRAIIAAFPGARVILAAPRSLEPLVPLVHPRLELCHVAGLAPLPDALDGAALAINLHGRGPQSTQLLESTRPRDLIAFGRARGGVTSTWQDDEHERSRWCRLLVEHGIPADASDLLLARPLQSGMTEGATVLHPGASARARRWSLRRWVRVAAALRSRGHELVITGGADERAAALVLGASLGLRDEQVTAGRTDLAQLAAVVASARLVVSGDTGVAHLAFAYRRPSVTLYGPVSPAVWGPPSEGPHEVLWAGRTGNPHARRRHPGLRRIGVDDVLGASDRALNRCAGPRVPTSPRY